MRREEALQRLERDHMRRGLSPVTRAARISLARKFLERLGKPVQRVRTDDVRAYLARRRAEGMAGTTLALELSHLRAFFKTVLDQDPSDGVQVAHGGPEPPLVLSRESVRLLLAEALRGPGNAAIKLRDRACLELLYGAGLRVSEAAAIEITDLSLADQSLIVRSAKGGAPRALPLPAAAVVHVTRYLKDGRPALADRGRAQSRLLLTRSGRPVTGRGVTSIVDRIGQRAGVRVHAHALRRALATHLVAAGVNVEAVRRLLGHANLETTAGYVAIQSKELHRLVRVLDLRRSVGQDV